MLRSVQVSVFRVVKWRRLIAWVDSVQLGREEMKHLGRGVCVWGYRVSCKVGKMEG